MTNITSSISVASALGEAPSSPLDVPEILAEISSYLSPRDVYRCIFVNKIFRSLFSRILWKDVKLGPERQAPFVTASSARYNAHLVQSVDFLLEATLFCQPYLSLDFAILHEVRINVLRNQQLLTLNKEPAGFLFRHRTTIHVLHVTSQNFGTHSSIFWKNVLQLQALGTLALEDVVMSGDDLEGTFLNVLARMTSLRLARVRLENLRTTTLEQRESELKHIEFQGCSFDFESFRAISRLLKISTQLRALIWGPWTMLREKGVTSGTFAPVTAIVKSEVPWKNLERMDVCRLEGDRVFQTFAVFTRGISELVLREVALDEKAIAMLLDNLAAKLIKIQLESCKGLESSMVQDILCSCCNLLSIWVDIPLLFSSVRQSSDQWSCLKLREWIVSVEMDQQQEDDSRYFFDKLCRLEELRVLNVSSTYARLDTDASFLMFRQDTGFRSLSTLQQLQVLNVRHTRQEMRRGDWEWLLETFRGLKTVVGFRVASGEETEWRDALARRAISYSR